MESGRRGALFAHIKQVFDQHPKGRSPVAHVVASDHVMSGEAIHARQGVANHGGAKVTNVHLFGDIGRRVVDDHAERFRGRGEAQS
jgi:hypothetical protein